jgi:cell wall-associated NlpC family hydrolase/murein DD-endopeptidase MepM/ murein hydrolase activator NlpD
VSSPEETKQAADLIERLLTDATFRAEFRRDPASACERFGLTELAEELRGGGSAKALYTLELRQSMSSLAGVIMAAAAEGIGALDLAGFGSSPDKRVAGVVNEALSRHSIKAISQAQMHAVGNEDHGDAVAVDEVPSDDVSADAGCGACGDPSGVCGHTPGDGCPHCGDSAGACGHGASDCSTCGHHGPGCGHGVACGACGDSSGVCGHTPGKGCPHCGDSEGACGHGQAACAVCGDSGGACNHSHADRKREAGLAHGHHGHAHAHAGHSHAPGAGHGHGHAQAGHAHAHGGARPAAAAAPASVGAMPAAPAPAQEEPHVAPAPVQEQPHAAPAPAAPVHEHSHAGHSHGPSLAEVGGPAVAPSDELAALLENPNLELPGPARADLASGRVDPRLVSMLTALTKEHKIGLSVVITGHDQYSASGSVSNHFVGRGLDIASVDGEIVRPNSIASRELAEALTDLPESIKPTEVGTPWPIGEPGFFTDGAHQDHLHIAFDGAAPENFQSPVAPAAAAPAAAAPAAAGAAAVPAPEAAAAAADARSSGVFEAAPAGGNNGSSTVGAMPAVEQPAPAQPAAPVQPVAAPAVPVEPSAAPAAIPLPDVSDVYPGDEAPKEQIAAWMARQAHKAGLPGELPIMAALVESRLSNINYGDADSVGFFQMRTSIWDQGEYAGYGEKPELQLKWFLDHALHEKQKRVARGETAFLKDSSKWGEWIADVERPAEQYRGRYQERLTEARELLGGAQAGAPPPVADATLDAATAGAELDAAPQAKKALAIAKEYLGTPYQWGGATPETNFDCSGLMQWAYKQVGIEIPRVTYDQVNVGEKIPKVDDLEAGDLVFFQDSSGDMHHVGMYIGDHKFIHAPHTGDVVKVSSLDEPYYQEQFAGGRRIVDAVPEAGAPVQLAAVPGAVPAAPAAPGAVQMPIPEPESRESGVFAAPAAASGGGGQTVGAMPAVAEQPQQQQQPVAVEAVAAPTPVAVPGAPVAPVAPEDMANTNEGGKLHASEFHVHDAEGAPGAEGNLHAGYDLFARPGAPVRSPIAGTVVEVKASHGNTGQIFGGVVKVQGDDGRVWVFRHVDPKGVVEGGRVTAGQEIAGVTEWAGGAHHAHIELWKTLEGGYNVANMEDPYAELQKAYAGGGAELPAPVEHAGHDHAGHDHGGGGELAAAGPAVPASAQLEALLANPNLELPGPARADLASGRVDPRLVSMLSELTKEHKIGLSVIITGHDKMSSSGSVSNHFVGRGLDIASVDGEIVRANSIASRELAEALTDLPESIKPTEVGTPWPIGEPGFFTDGAHQDHLHIAFDDPPPADFVAPAAAPAAPAAPVAPVAAPVVAPAGVPTPEVPVAEPEPAVASGVFKAAPDEAAASKGNTVQFMQAVKAEMKDQLQAAPEPDLEPAKIEAQAVEVAATVGGYPGDNAPKEQIAAWMAARAQAAGLPPELPVMAALVESRLSNINFGDADSIGFFQMRTSIWDQGEYAGYGQDPEKQIKWFIDHAVHEKEKRVADGYTNFLTDESKWGDWVADVERPAEQYRGRYQERLAEARALLGGGAA